MRNKALKEMFADNGMSDFENTYNTDYLEGKDTNVRKKSLTKSKLEILEAAFKQNPFPSKQFKINLAMDLDLELAKIKNWFQNRRAREKKNYLTSDKNNDDQNFSLPEVFPSCNNLYVRRPCRKN